MAAQPDPPTFNPQIAYITAADGSRFQVLNVEGDDWDELATAQSYVAYLQGRGLSQ